MADIKVALIGYGYAGKTIHAPLIRAARGLDLALIVSSRPADVHADLPDVKVVPDITIALENPDIDLVVIATPNELHAPLAHLAIDAGKHIVIDKPFALSVAEADSVLSHAEPTKRLVSVFHCRRWDSPCLTFASLRSKLGELYQFRLNYNRWRPEVRDRWRERAGPGSGLWFDLGSHLMDQALYLFGEPEWISADIALQRPGAQTDDYFDVTLAYGRLRVILHASMLTVQSGTVIEAEGENGVFTSQSMDTQEDMLKAGRTPGDIGWGASSDATVVWSTRAPGGNLREQVPAIPGNYLAYYETVAQAIRGTAPNPVPGLDARRVMTWLELGFASASQGCRMSLKG